MALRHRPRRSRNGLLRQAIDALTPGRVRPTIQIPTPLHAVRDVDWAVGPARLGARLTVPTDPLGWVVIAHAVADCPCCDAAAESLGAVGLASMRFSLRGTHEARTREADRAFVADRIADAARWLQRQPESMGRPVGLLGVGPAAGGSLAAAALLGRTAAGIVACGEAHDLALSSLIGIGAPTRLLLRPEQVTPELRREAARLLGRQGTLVTLPPGAAVDLRSELARLLAAEWLSQHLTTTPTAAPWLGRLARVRHAAGVLGRRDVAAAVLLALTAVVGTPRPSLAAVTAAVAGSVLTVTGDGASDSIEITCVGGQVNVNGADPVPPTLCSAITQIIVNAGGGNDTIDLDAVTSGNGFTGINSVTLNGEAGNDSIIGSAFADVLNGGSDNDTLVGFQGADTMNGEAGDDVMVWNPGDGDDTMEGGDGTGDQVLFNGAGADEPMTINPGAVAGRIAFERNPGDVDLDIGTAESILVNALGGNDTITGAAGIAPVFLILNGGEGDDLLTGGDGNDLLNGGSDNDTLVGFQGADTMNGDAGDDVMVWNPGDGDDTMEGGDGTADQVLFNGAAAAEPMTINPGAVPGRIAFERNPGDVDLDIGTAESILVNALGGNDTITGAAGIAPVALILNGGDGDDLLTGGDGNDLLNGGSDNDTLIGFRGNDTMIGADGNDLMVWNNGDGSDTMDGEAGDDRAQVNGSSTAGDIFAVANNGSRIRFTRNNLGLFSLDIGTSETLEVNGQGGDDTMTAAPNENTRLLLNGGDGTDRLTADRTGLPAPTQSGTPANGEFLFTGRQPIQFTAFEQLEITPNVCAPRPNVRMQVFKDTPGRLRAVVTSLVSEGTTANSLTELRFTGFQNAIVDVPNGPQNQTGAFTFPVNPNTSEVTFFVRRANPGQTTTVQLTARDQCGDWQTLVGGGPNAF